MFSVFFPKNSFGGDKMKKKCLIIVSVLLISCLFWGCGQEETASGPEGSASQITTLAGDAQIEIIGEDLHISLDAEEILARPHETFSCTNISSSGEVATEKVTGFSLDELLLEQGIDMKDVTSLNFVATDGYMIAAPADLFAETPVYIIYKRYDDEALEYPSACIPNQRAMYWARELIKVEVTAQKTAAKANEATVKRISIFREGINELQATALDNQGYKVNSYSLAAYFEEFLPALPQKPVTMIARDKFEKTETPEVFLGAYVSLEAEKGKEEETPFYFSEDMPPGMRVKYLDIVLAGEDAIYFGNEIALAELFSAVGMEEASAYMFTASDGWTVEIPADAIPFGRILMEENEGYTRACFADYDKGTLPGQGNIKYLLAIEALN